MTRDVEMGNGAVIYAVAGETEDEARQRAIRIAIERGWRTWVKSVSAPSSR